MEVYAFTTMKKYLTVFPGAVHYAFNDLKCPYFSGLKPHMAEHRELVSSMIHSAIAAAGSESSTKQRHARSDVDFDSIVLQARMVFHRTASEADNTTDDGNSLWLSQINLHVCTYFTITFKCKCAQSIVKFEQDVSILDKCHRRGIYQFMLAESYNTTHALVSKSKMQRCRWVQLVWVQVQVHMFRVYVLRVRVQMIWFLVRVQHSQV